MMCFSLIKHYGGFGDGKAHLQTQEVGKSIRERDGHR
jgi:hypothetical protein